VIHILEKYLSKPKSFDLNPTEEFLKLAGSWEDTRSAKDIVREIKSGRNNSDRFGLEIENWAA